MYLWRGFFATFVPNRYHVRVHCTRAIDHETIFQYETITSACCVGYRYDW
jgi:hypothetical protein